jgi:UDP-glucose 4-epimerase
MKPTLLLTGGYGFVGAALLPILKKHFDVRVITKTHHAASDILWDLTKPYKGSLPKSDVVIHLAARTAKGDKGIIHASEYYKSNVLGTKHLLSALKNPTYFLYVSTTDVYGVVDGLITENTAPMPQTSYAKSKLEAEKIVNKFAKKHGISYGIARLGSVYGPGEQGYQKVIPVFIQKALRKEKLVILGNGKETRQFIHVTDVARALSLLVQKQYEGIIHIAGTKKISMSMLAQTINTLTQNSKGVTKNTAPRHSIELSVQALNDMGFRERVSFDKGLQEEIQSLQKRRIIVFDMDGTIVDHKKRSYSLYAIYASIHKVAVLPLETFWRKKTQGVSEFELLGLTRGEEAAYKAWKRERIEDKKLLDSDSLIPGIKMALQKSAKKSTLVVLSARQSKPNLEYQLKKMGLRKYFSHVLTAPESPMIEAKRRAIEDILRQCGIDKQDIITIGDTVGDYKAAKALGIKTLSVSWGIQDKKLLRTGGVETIVTSISELEQEIFA